ncbi:MAG: EamA family transporter [Nanoarchaeota archaeon]|nr:EamA family transporter [Nanoarchaeota archaeon]
MTELWAVLLVALAATVGAMGPLYMKRASASFTFHPKAMLNNKNLLLGILFYALGTLLFIPALRGGELSVLYPVVALVYVWVPLLSIKFLGEKMNTMKWTGVALIILGVSLIGLGA